MALWKDPPTLPCLTTGCDGRLALPDPRHKIALYQCGFCKSWVVAERIRNDADGYAYLMHAVQVPPGRLRKGDVVLRGFDIWYTNPPRIERVYVFVRLSAGGKNPRDEHGAKIDTTTIVGKVVGEPVEVSGTWA